MLTTVEGVYKKGRIELMGIPTSLEDSRVLVTFLQESRPAHRGQMMVYGQFAGGNMATEEDFKIAEWHGEAGNGDGD